MPHGLRLKTSSPVPDVPPPNLGGSGKLTPPTWEVIKESPYSPKKLVPENGVTVLCAHKQQLFVFLLFEQSPTSTLCFPQALKGKLYRSPKPLQTRM